MLVEIGAMCELGTRESQQDSYLYYEKDDCLLAVVCDGMGGMNGGDKASRCAVQMLLQDYKNMENKIQDIPCFFETEVVKLDNAIYSLTDSAGNVLRAGSTIVAIVVQQDELYWLTVGDSRIFVLRGNEIVPVNQKHNYKLQLDEMLKEKCISKYIYERELKHADKLISYLGVGDVSIWDINETPLKLKTGDYILLCSDGITNTITEEELQVLIQREDSIEESVKKITRRIRQNQGGQDNATCILVKYID